MKKLQSKQSQAGFCLPTLPEPVVSAAQ